MPIRSATTRRRSRSSTRPARLVVSVPAASITQNGNAAQYTVNAPAFTLPEEGTYQVVVSVTDSGGATPITVAGASHGRHRRRRAHRRRRPCSSAATPASRSAGYGRRHLHRRQHRRATSATSPAVIDWGDGSPNSVGTIVAGAAPATFDVDGSHTYAKPGVYTVTTNVIDVGGSTVTLTGTVTVTDLPSPARPRASPRSRARTPARSCWRRSTDPNTLATVADVNATLAIGGWGDGTPTVAGVTLVVQQIGVDPANGDPIFEVLGSHTYAEETPRACPTPSASSSRPSVARPPR